MEQLGESAENHTTQIRTRDLPVMYPAQVPTGPRRLADHDLFKPTLGDAVTSRSGRRRHFEAIEAQKCQVSEECPEKCPRCSPDSDKLSYWDD